MTSSKQNESVMEKLTGRFYQRIYRSQDNSYCVCLYSVKSDSDAQYITVIGNGLPEVPYPVTFSGKWATSKKHGRYFKVEMVVSMLPVTTEDIIKFLSSMKAGIGKKLATEMVNLVGPERFWMELSSDPLQFSSIPGLSEKSVYQVLQKSRALSYQQNLIQYLADDLPLTAKQYKQICKYFADRMDRMLDIIRDNPFVLIDCGYSFRELDAFCIKRTTFPVNDYRRLSAAAKEVLLEAKSNCHVGLPYEVMLHNLGSLLMDKGFVSRWDLEAFIPSAVESGVLVYENGLIYLPRAYQEECRIAQVITQMCAKPAQDCSKDRFHELMAEYAKLKGFSLSAEQQAAVWMALTQSFSIITGGPGCGKSTILDALLYCWKDFFDDKWLLMAPTGKAAVRMTETTGQYATTIHSTLGLNVGNNSTEEMDTQVNPLYSSLVVVDEASMIDQSVMASLSIALQSEEVQHLVLVGDPDQLPSVSWGNVLADLIACDVVPVARLKTVFRQGAESPIITNSRKMQNGETDLDFSHNSFYRFDFGTDERNVEGICKFYLSCVRRHGIENVVLLTPYRSDRHALSVNKINRALQAALNPEGSMPQVKYGSRFFRTGDRVMQLSNTDSLANGDIGTIQSVNPQAGETESCVIVRFENGTTQGYLRDDLVQLDLAYALTVHKAQGSQYKNVLTILPKRVTSFIKRNVLYTAITRSELNVAIFASLESIAQCIQNAKPDERHTALAVQMRERHQMAA